MELLNSQLVAAPLAWLNGAGELIEAVHLGLDGKLPGHDEAAVGTVLDLVYPVAGVLGGVDAVDHPARLDQTLAYRHAVQNPGHVIRAVVEAPLGRRGLVVGHTDHLPSFPCQTMISRQVWKYPLEQIFVQGLDKLRITVYKEN